MARGVRGVSAQNVVPQFKLKGVGLDTLTPHLAVLIRVFFRFLSRAQKANKAPRVSRIPLAMAPLPVTVGLGMCRLCDATEPRSAGT